MKKKIEMANERVRKMEKELKRLDKKYLETKDELYKGMAENTARDINKMILAIMDAERDLIKK